MSFCTVFFFPPRRRVVERLRTDAYIHARVFFWEEFILNHVSLNPSFFVWRQPQKIVLHDQQPTTDHHLIHLVNFCVCLCLFFFPNTMASLVRVGLLTVLFVLAALMLFFILYALLICPKDNRKATPHHHHPHHHTPSPNKPAESACDCDDDADNDKTSTGTGTDGTKTGTSTSSNSTTATGTTTGTMPGSVTTTTPGPPPLSTPFLDYVKQPGLNSLGITPASHPAEWTKIWTSGTLSRTNPEAPRVEFYYGDYCMACMRFKPMWEEASSWFPARLQRAVVSCGESENALACAAIQKIPTVIFRRNAHDAGVVFTAPKTKESLLEFVNSNYQLYQESL
jgi:hypothetical protein